MLSADPHAPLASRSRVPPAGLQDEPDPTTVFRQVGSTWPVASPSGSRRPACIGSLPICSVPSWESGPSPDRIDAGRHFRSHAIPSAAERGRPGCYPRRRVAPGGRPTLIASIPGAANRSTTRTPRWPANQAKRWTVRFWRPASSRARYRVLTPSRSAKVSRDHRRRSRNSAIRRPTLRSSSSGFSFFTRRTGPRSRLRNDEHVWFAGAHGSRDAARRSIVESEARLRRPAQCPGTRMQLDVDERRRQLRGQRRLRGRRRQRRCRLRRGNRRGGRGRQCWGRRRAGWGLRG